MIINSYIKYLASAIEDVSSEWADDIVNLLATVAQGTQGACFE